MDLIEIAIASFCNAVGLVIATAIVGAGTGIWLWAKRRAKDVVDDFVE